MRKQVIRLSIMRTRVALEFWRKVQARHRVVIGGLPLYPWPMQFAPRFVFAALSSRWLARGAIQESGRFAFRQPQRDVPRKHSSVRAAMSRTNVRARFAANPAVRAAAPLGDRGVVRSGKRDSDARAEVVRACTRSPTGLRSLSDLRANRLRVSFAERAGLVPPDRRSMTMSEGSSLQGKRDRARVEVGVPRSTRTAPHSLVSRDRTPGARLVGRAISASSIGIIRQRSGKSMDRFGKIEDSPFRHVGAGKQQTRVTHTPSRGERRHSDVHPDSARLRTTNRGQVREVTRTNLLSQARHQLNAPGHRTRSAAFDRHRQARDLTLTNQGFRSQRVANPRASRTRHAVFGLHSIKAWQPSGPRSPQRTDGRATPRQLRLSARGARWQRYHVVRVADSPRVADPVRRVLRQRTPPDHLHQERTVAARQVHIMRDAPRPTASKEAERADAPANNELPVAAARRVLLPLLQEALSSERTTGRLKSGVMTELSRRDRAEQYRKTGGR
jgi:hypothetical protein